MSQPFVGELRMFGFGYAPKGWAFANGQTMSIQQNQALFALFGTTYGGNGQTSFLLPNLQGGVPFHRGNGMTQGQKGGSATVTLNIAQIPAHQHQLFVSSGAATGTNPVNQAPAQANNNIYGPPNSVILDPGVMQNTGGSQPHNNMQPYLPVVWCVALVGIFPSRN